MNKALSVALLVVGVILFSFGVQAYNSLGSGVSRLFTGSPTDRAILLLAGGAGAAIFGLFGLGKKG